MSPFAILVHTWRLRRIRWAFAALNRRLAAYEARYGLAAVRLGDERDVRTAHTLGGDQELAHADA